MDFQQAGTGALAAMPAMLSAAVDYVAVGGPFAYANLVVLAGALVVIAERFATLAFRLQWPAAPFMEQIGKLVLVGNVERALKLCDAAPPQAPLPQVIRAGLERARDGELEISKALADALRRHTTPLQGRLRWLVVLAQAAAVLGLGGAAVSLLTAGPHLGPSLSRAMASGTFGLGIAVVCLVMQSSLSGYAQKTVDEVERSALELERLLARGQSVGGA